MGVRIRTRVIGMEIVVLEWKSELGFGVKIRAGLKIVIG